MPQNWWEAFPEVMPSPAARPYPLPGPGGLIPGPAMGLRPDPLSGAPLLGQAPVGPFDPSYFSGGQAGAGQFPGSSPDHAPPINYPQPPIAGDPAGLLSDRRLAVQQAAAAIRDGADPKAVRARLNQVGTDGSGFDISDLFADLVPGGPQGSWAMDPSGPAQPDLLPGVQPNFGGDRAWGHDDLDGGAGDARDSDAPVPDSASAIQHAADAIQLGADLNAVRARLNQMGHGDQEPPSPFSSLTPKGGTAMGRLLPLSMQMRPAFDDQGGFAPRATGTSFAPDPLGGLPPRLDPRLAPQKSDGLQKASLQTASTDAGPTTFFTYGLPSYPFPRDARGVAPRPVPGRSGVTRPDPYSEANLTLGPNEQYRAAIVAAARANHLTPHGLAATIGAEMLPGRWNSNAVNGQTGATGLSQFTTDTWFGEANRRGSFLNGVANRFGYLDRQGHLAPDHRAQFLALRNNPTTSIWAAADYAAHNLGVLRDLGYIRNESPAALARYAYLAHHEGLVGAQRFLRGAVNIDESTFLNNIRRPSDRARYLAASGNDRNRAYREFHSDFVDRNVDVTRYMIKRDGVRAPPTRTLFR